MEEKHVEKEESLLAQLLIGAIVLVISLLFVVGIILGIAYLFNN